MSEYDIKQKLETQLTRTQLLRSMISFALADLSNPEGSLGEEHHINLYKAIVSLLDHQNSELEELLEKL